MIPQEETQDALSVSELSFRLKGLVETQFSHVFVRGEISGAKAHSSGHLYFALKDAQSVLDCVCWRGTLSRQDIAPQDGMGVLIHGKLTTYPGRSKYQLVVESLSLSGEGTLLKLLEERRRRLAAEGLFDEARKRPLPLLPQTIGLITSPTGAVIQDILHRLEDRCPRNVLVWGVAVQGERAVPDIIRALQGFNADDFPLPRPDVLIVARGGGSLEDLWAFNDEDLVRAVAASRIPVISGVGHEPDVTLIDYVADWRAPTPTAAAERVVPVKRDLLGALDVHMKRLEAGLARLTRETEQRLDERAERFVRLGPATLERLETTLTQLGKRLKRPEDILAQSALRLEAQSVRLGHAALRLLSDRGTRLETLSGLLASYSYTHVLARGFSITRDASGRVIQSAAKATPGMNVTLTFHDGTRDAVIAGRAPKKAKPLKEPSSTQQSLFSSEL
ncbi:MAG: exodeoxyribonuclease VII large subunit [Proteobacteria bacterium]|nr:exodeoxyribonuclease VII large subunit [Pseudomonadota bacterium]